MSNDWHELTDLTGDRSFTVTSVRLDKGAISIEGDFDLPPLARLRYEDQVFAVEFLAATARSRTWRRRSASATRR